MKEERSGPGWSILGCFGVILLLAIGLGGYGYSFVRSIQRDGDSFRAQADLETLKASLIRYKIRSQTYPTQEQGLDALARKPAVEPVPDQWKMLIEPTLLIDPWGNPYQYRHLGDREDGGVPCELWSWGPDGKEGTGDDIHEDDD